MTADAPRDWQGNYVEQETVHAQTRRMEQEERAASAATRSGSGLTDYDKGYLDGLLAGTGKTTGGSWTDRYEKAATEYLEQRGFKGWKVNAKRI